MLRWGVIGPGGIAGEFAEANALVEGSEIVAVVSRSLERANRYAEAHGIPNRYDRVADLCADPNVDAIYVATPHSSHEQDALAALRAGKHVLCEKPLALNARQSTAMVDEARTRGLFLMEAIWSRFLPAYRALVDVLGEGEIGEPLLVEGEFGFRGPTDPAHRLYDPALGGGSLLDLGIYPLQLCTLVLGIPERVAASGVIGDTGVDELVAATLTHRAGLGIIKSATRASLTCTARITGTDGRIDIPAFMHCPDALTVVSPTGTRTIDAPFQHGLHFEIEEAQRCIAAGQVESPVMPLDESVALAGIMDTIRSQIGVTYPGE